MEIDRIPDPLVSVQISQRARQLAAAGTTGEPTNPERAAPASGEPTNPERAAAPGVVRHAIVRELPAPDVKVRAPGNAPATPADPRVRSYVETGRLAPDEPRALDLFG